MKKDAKRRGRPPLPPEERMVRHLGLKLTAKTSRILDEAIEEASKEARVPVSGAVYVARLLEQDAKARFGKRILHERRAEAPPKAIRLDDSVPTVVLKVRLRKDVVQKLVRYADKESRELAAMGRPATITPQIAIDSIVQARLLEEEKKDVIEQAWKEQSILEKLLDPRRAADAALWAPASATEATKHPPPACQNLRPKQEIGAVKHAATSYLGFFAYPRKMV